MALQSPQDDPGDTWRDRYHLDLLTEDLAARELAHPQSLSASEYESDSDLPISLPLSHDNPYLTAEKFSVEEFLISRSHTSLADLSSELQDYHSLLKEELVKLINDDYEAFISLSTDLQGEGSRLQSLKRPLGDLKIQVSASKKELQLIQDTVQQKLLQRAELREQKSLLHLLLKISESVTRLESLLLIAEPPQDAISSDTHGRRISHTLTIEDDSTEERGRKNHAQHLGRVAVEYNQLLYHASKARTQRCVFIDEIQWQIDRIRSTISLDLDRLFASKLLLLIDGRGETRTTEAEKAKVIADINECLRTYDILRLWRDAEDVLRREVVRGFVKKTIFPGALTAPHSPIVPHTPFPTRAATSFFPGPHPPRTPYTPFTAFASKQNPFDVAYGAHTASSPYAHLLDDSEDALASLYNQILRFVERDLCRIMEMAEKVSIKATSQPRLERSTTETVLPVIGRDVLSPQSAEKHEGFEIMANVVWAELASAIMAELGSVVFSSGRPSEFRKHYETTQAFIRSLEFLAPSMNSIVAMRSHPVYLAFERRWQLPVYFQLRWKEIVMKVEGKLLSAKTELTANEGDDRQSSFATVQAHAIWDAVLNCWAADVYIPDLSHRFWKLTLQLLSRFRSWLDSLEVASANGSHTEEKSAPGSNTPLTRSGTPAQSSEVSSLESAAVDDAILKQCASIIVDVYAMQSRMMKLWQEEISITLPEGDDNDAVDPAEALQQALSGLTTLIPQISSQITTILTKRCCNGLLPVRSIPSQIRAMSNKRTPSEPSYFVSSILRPLKNFFGIDTVIGHGAALKDEFMEPYTVDVFELVCQRYLNYLTDLKKTEESLKRLKTGQRSTFTLFGSTSTSDGDSRDGERIRSQMILDVEAFGKDAQSLGVSLGASEAFASLQNMVRSTFLEGLELS